MPQGALGQQHLSENTVLKEFPLASDRLRESRVASGKRRLKVGITHTFQVKKNHSFGED